VPHSLAADPATGQTLLVYTGPPGPGPGCEATFGSPAPAAPGRTGSPSPPSPTAPWRPPGRRSSPTSPRRRAT
jgi:hypothetical protein